MFQCEDLFGTITNTIDYKNRIVVPSFTGVVPQNKLLLFQDNDFFSIYSYHYFIQKVKKHYLGELEHANFLEEKHIIDAAYSHVLATVIVDLHNRIQIPKFVIDYYRLVQFDEMGKRLSSNVIVSGCNDHINVFRDRKTFDTFVRSKKRILN